VILVGLAIDQIAQSGLSSLSVIYYSAQLFSLSKLKRYNHITAMVSPVMNAEDERTDIISFLLGALKGT
ncbi:hypothetical protein, partial [Serratia nevei]